MVLLIIPEKDMATAQSSDLTSAESRVSSKIKNSWNCVECRITFSTVNGICNGYAFTN